MSDTYTVYYIEIYKTEVVYRGGRRIEFPMCDGHWRRPIPPPKPIIEDIEESGELLGGCKFINFTTLLRMAKTFGMSQGQIKRAKRTLDRNLIDKDTVYKVPIRVSEKYSSYLCGMITDLNTLIDEGLTVWI